MTSASSFFEGHFLLPPLSLLPPTTMSSRRKGDASRDLLALEGSFEVVLSTTNMSGKDIIPIETVCETSRYQIQFFAETQTEKQKDSHSRHAQERRANKASSRAKQQMLMKLTHGNEAPLLMANEEEEGFDLNVDSLQKSERLLSGKAPSESRKLQEQLERVMAKTKSSVKKKKEDEFFWDNDENQDDVLVWDGENDEEDGIEDPCNGVVVEPEEEIIDNSIGYPDTDEEDEEDFSQLSLVPPSFLSPRVSHCPLALSPPSPLPSSPVSSPSSPLHNSDSEDDSTPSAPPSSFSFPPNLPKTLLSSSSPSPSSYSQHFVQSSEHFVLSSLLSETPQSALRSPTKRKRKRETAEELQHDLNSDFLTTKLTASKRSNKSAPSSSSSPSSPSSSSSSPSSTPASKKNNNAGKRKIQDDQALSLQALRLSSSLHHPEKQHQLSVFRRSFPLWLSSLIRGRNLLLYGFGSKKLLIESFLHDGLVQNFPCLVVNGYHKGFSLKGLLDSITADLLGHEGVTFSTPLVQCEFVGQYFEACFPENKSSLSSPSPSPSTSSISQYPLLMTHLKPDERKRIRAPEHVFVVIHNIERVGGHAVHNILSLLASVPQIHLVASADHIFTPLDWDDGVRNRYNWVCEHTATYQPYYYETRDDSFFDQTSSNKEECIRVVLNALGDKGWDCFCVLARTTIAKNGEKGLSFGEWLTRCSEGGILSSEESLQKMIREFKDHFFLKEVNKEGQPFFKIIASSETLKNLIETSGK